MSNTFFTRQFGLIEYTPEAVIEFPDGIPAFEAESRFVLIEREGTPLIFLQSLTNSDLCFVTLPAGCVDARYQPKLEPSDFEALGMENANDQEVLCLVMLTIPNEGTPTVNMMAPIVIHRRTRRARQIIQFDSGYSFRQELPGSPAAGEVVEAAEGQPC